MSLDADVLEWLAADRAVSYCNLAVAVWVVYDHISTLDLEVELVWQRPQWSMVQILFLITRYVGDARQIFCGVVFVRHIVAGSMKVSVISSAIQGLLTCATLATMQGLMIFRISSMYHDQPKVHSLLIAGFLTETALLILLQCLSLISGVSTRLDIPEGVKICAKEKYPTWFYTLWIPIFLFELMMFLLSVRVGLKYYEFEMLRSRRRHAKSLVYILLRDSILYPFIAMSACIIGSVIWIKLPFTTLQMVNAFQGALPSILGSRLLLNLREAYYQPFQREFSFELDQQEDIEFTRTQERTVPTPLHIHV
ncbi:hypothetical protein B0H34DRAFT_524170 [Crassisporium funariophilum]|nr:hypothetical protein B0H34DRAFT_524170 [Crassisporium funariophilum]